MAADFETHPIGTGERIKQLEESNKNLIKTLKAVRVELSIVREKFTDLSRLNR